MDLSVGQKRKQLRDALLHAFPTKASLEQMLLYNLEKNLNEIAGDSSLQDIVVKLIQKAESDGWVEDLVCAAYASNHGNPELKQFVQQIFSSSDNTLSNDCNKEKYEKIYLIRKGIYSEIYLAKNNLDKEVVFKELHNENIKNKFKETLTKALVISELPNFITIYDFDVSAEKPYYVMQYIQGYGSLRDYYKSNISFSSTEEVVNIILRIGYAMIKAREKEASPSYLNINPSNIMIDKKNEPFISAFNLCVNLEPEEIFSEIKQLFDKDKERFKEELTYLLPDKFNSKGVTNKSDQYMLGLLAYELITNKIPPTIEDINKIEPYELISKLKKEKDGGSEVFQKISFHDGDVDKKYPDEIKDIILKMTNLDPEQRFEDLKEALDIIEIYSRFTDTRKIIKIVKESFIKCIHNKNHPTFFKTFYDKFILEPGVSEKFANKDKEVKNFWEIHHKLVEKAILLFFWYYEEESIFKSVKTPETDEKLNFLDSIVVPHTNLDISEELFDSFKRILIDSVIEFDDKCNEETYKNLIKSAWKEVLKPGFDYIKSKYQNEKVSQRKTCPHQRLPAHS